MIRCELIVNAESHNTYISMRIVKRVSQNDGTKKDAGFGSSSAVFQSVVIREFTDIDVYETTPD